MNSTDKTSGKQALEIAWIAIVLYAKKNIDKNNCNINWRPWQAYTTVPETLEQTR